MEDTADPRVGRKLRLLYILTPLFLLIVCLGTINLAPALVTVVGAGPTLSTPMVTLAKSNAAEDTAAVVSSHVKQESVAAPTRLPTPTPTVMPTAPPGAEIQLLGPPPGSAFRIGDTLSFYWQLSVPLAEDQTLAVYLLTQNQEHLLGRLSKANIGHSYRLHVVIDEATGVAGKVQWQVRLESTQPKQWLATSETRPLALLAAPESLP